MDNDLPDLYSSNTDGDNGVDRKPQLLSGVMDALKNGVSADVGNAQFKLTRKNAQAMMQIGGAMLEMTVNGHMEARAKAHMPLMGGNVEVEANRDAEGRQSFGAHSSTPAFGGNLDVNANVDADGNRRVGIQFGKTF